MSATLDDVMRVMRSQEQKQDETTSAIADLTQVFRRKFLKEERDSGDRLEAERERRTDGDDFDISKLMAIPGLDALNNSIQGLVMMGTNFAKMIAGIGLGIAGVLAALAGIRGWEAQAIANIGKIGKALDNLFPNTLSGTIGKAIDDLRLGILRRVFGIGPEGKMIRGADGRFAGKLSVADAVRDAMAGLRTSVLARFGIGADGKLISVKGADGKFKTNFVGRVTMQVRSLFRPIQTLGETLGKFFEGKTFQAITKFLGVGGKVILGIFKKVFYPIGLVFAAFDGIKAYMESDAQTIIGQLGDGIGGFVGDFIGAPFDLLKAGINYVFDKIFGVKRDADGNVTTEGWASWASTKMTEFSFEKLIGNIVAAPFKVIEAGYLFVKDLFTDPKEAFTNLWTNLTGIAPGLFSFGSYIFDTLIKPVWEFVTGFFKHDPKEENALGQSMDNLLTGTINLFKNIGHFISGIGDIIATQVEFEIKAVINGFKNSFDRVATFIRNLGDNLYIMMSNALQFNFPGIIIDPPSGIASALEYLPGLNFPLEIMPPFSLGLGNSETRAAAESRIDTRNAKMYNRISARNSETALAFADAEEARANLMQGLQPVIINQDNRQTNNSSTSDRRTYVATGAATDGFSLTQSVQ